VVFGAPQMTLFLLVETGLATGGIFPLEALFIYGGGNFLVISSKCKGSYWSSGAREAGPDPLSRFQFISRKRYGEMLSYLLLFAWVAAFGP
jgi:hypothetical protein